MKVEEISSCDFANWYPKFEKCTIPSKILELPSNVLSYLLDPGTLVLPSDQPRDSNTSSSSSSSARTCNAGDLDGRSTKHKSPNKVSSKKSPTQPAEYDSDDEEVLNWPEDDTTKVEAPALDEFSSKITAAIRRLGGSVFPKLNWTAPKDAVWMSYTGSLKCTSASDVYLLLKSSDHIGKDLLEPFQECTDDEVPAHKAVLVLRKWRDINPSGEFRCFVTQGRLMGMCPRDVSQFYSCLVSEHSSIVADVCSFWRENIDNRFPLKNYAFDIVRLAKDNVLLLDFSPLHESRTRGLLFDWEELRDACVSSTPDVTTSVNISDQVNCEMSNSVESMNLRNADSNRAHEEGLDYNTAAREHLEDGPEFRFISTETGVQPSMDRLYGMPHDLLQLPELCKGNIEDLLRMQAQIGADCQFSDEET